jgi:hypothetical protein
VAERNLQMMKVSVEGLGLYLSMMETGAKMERTVDQVPMCLHLCKSGRNVEIEFHVSVLARIF